MIYKGNIRKMKGFLDKEVQYILPLYNIIEPSQELYLNPYIGKRIKISWQNRINCTVTGEFIDKTYGDGMSYKAFMSSPLASPSIIRPELSRIHEGIALRDEEWEREHHLKPHIVYLSITNAPKVGVTREDQIPTRWIDQGAIQAIIMAKTPYRQLAGLIEVELKEYISDKTSWQKMLSLSETDFDLIEKKKELSLLLSNNYHKFLTNDMTVEKINFPVLQYPIKPKSIKLNKQEVIEEVLVGIKGQYLIFDSGIVINMRSHSGYEVIIEL